MTTEQLEKGIELREETNNLQVKEDKYLKAKLAIEQMDNPLVTIQKTSYSVTITIDGRGVGYEEGQYFVPFLEALAARIKEEREFAVNEFDNL